MIVFNREKRYLRLSMTENAALLSCVVAEWTTTANNKPNVSTMMYCLRPLIFFPPCNHALERFDGKFLHYANQ